jgi:hypothetical protein
MSIRTLGALQWVGVFVGALTWTAQHVIGYGVTDAACSPAGLRWGIGMDTWQITLMIVAGLIILAAEAAAVAVFLSTRESEDQDPPPGGRLQFFAAAAMFANLLFFAIVLLDGIASVSNVLCRQA